ncbi:hypothetical protein CYVG_00134 [Cyanophage S-SSM6a]|uniref:DUF680 domain-containing protein n=1 Tax=Synechococcus phage S-SSM7 TaxID=445686 RepID=E3SLI3_9CAUD|nr:DUF680 domain-containing protein [Synechococcus phage S-SSM7]ADO98331.1 DUF680 domain-containing protein [Synechococcus phage S-SSM7]AGH07578.1 hypothetical protein CYVG_00134 [Cyanophage S-SSM6a]|tara:strand:+ start:1054 stop:1401 length:348 start_codon:yes stop_codon:yes gene_type:complete
MFKSVIAATAAAPLFAGAAIAGPYVNVETNSSFNGGDYTATTAEFALGYEGSNWFVQGGPVVTAPDAGTNDTDFLAKAGGSVALSESVVGYGELSFQTDDVDNDYGVKAGVKYVF